MDALAILDRLSFRPALECGNFPPQPPQSWEAMAWAFSATAAIELSGMDCHTDDDLSEALDHFWTLLYGGVVTRDEWIAATMELAEAVRDRENRSTVCVRTAAR